MAFMMGMVMIGEIVKKMLEYISINKINLS